MLNKRGYEELKPLNGGNRRGVGLRVNANADLKLWHEVWELLISSTELLSSREISRALNQTKARIEGILVSLSTHGIPVYEEQRGGRVVYGALLMKTHEQIDELIDVNEKENAKDKESEKING